MPEVGPGLVFYQLLVLVFWYLRDGASWVGLSRQASGCCSLTRGCARGSDMREEQEYRTGSNTPAPGTTSSTLPNSLITLSNAFSSCPQSVTSVFWNTARALSPLPFTPILFPLLLAGEEEVDEETSASASGRS